MRLQPCRFEICTARTACAGTGSSSGAESNRRRRSGWIPECRKVHIPFPCYQRTAEIANYHFTTLSPNLGVVDTENGGFVIADIPGLIEGASEGVGLGHEFLRHIERTRVIIHIVDAASTEDVTNR